MDGERKYGRHNFRKGIQTSRLVAAALRHVFAYSDGETNAADSGVHHLGHARACLAMILQLEHDDTIADDRHVGEV